MNGISRAIAAIGLFAAGPAYSDGVPAILDALRLSGSENMVGFALSHEALPASLHQARYAMLARSGFHGEPGEVTDSWTRFRPILTYDGNINGGSVGDSIVISGLRFNVVEDAVAKSGLLIGVGVDSGADIHLGDMTALHVSADAWAAWSPQHDIAKSGLELSACVEHQVSAATRLRGCADAYHLEYDLGKTQRFGVETGISHAFGTVSAFHEVDISLRNERDLGGLVEDQQIVSARYTSARDNGWALTAGGSLGTQTDGISMQERVFLSGARVIAGQPTRVVLGAQNNRGGQFLGESRSEKIYSVAVVRQLRDNLSVKVTAARTEARHDFFDQNSVGLDVNFRF